MENIFNKENCFDFIEWNYKNSESSFYGDQVDWNVTLLTAVNSLHSKIHSHTNRDGANEIRIHSNLIPLFETIPYYNSDTKKLGGRYDIVFDDLIGKDEIYVYHTDIFDLKYFFETVSEDENRTMLKLRSSENSTEQELFEEKKRRMALIKILNYKINE